MPTIYTLAEQLTSQPALLKRFHGEFHNLKKISTQRVARVQTKKPLSSDDQRNVHKLLLETKGDLVTHLRHATIFEIAYQPAITDPEHSAIQKILKTLPFYSDIEAVRLSTVYAFEGLSEQEVNALVKKYLYNELLHTFIPSGYEPELLTIKATAEPTEIIEGFCEMDLRELRELSVQRSLYMEDHFLLEVQRQFADKLKRDPTDAELEYLAQRTSDHCFHTTWKSLGLFKKLKLAVEKVLPSRPDIISVFVDNSGVMAVDSEPSTLNSELTYFMKGETHNSPTAIAPVGGVETMHGGCIRDIMGTGQGGFPTMATQVFIVGRQSKEEMGKDYEVESFLDPLVILRGMIQGVQNYGNPMGIPNFGGRVFRHPKFFGKPLALGICVGLGEKSFSKKGKPKPGDIALLIGNPTGRDGIHGATMSSAANTEQTMKKEGAAVQIGDPYIERLIMEATSELRPLIRAYGDLGAGGIASCFGEMAEGVGIEINLEHIPTKYEGLSPWEKLESESQERMGIAMAPEYLEQVKKILQAHEIPCHVLGAFTGKNRFVVKHATETIVDLPYEWLEEFPIPEKRVESFFSDQHEVHLESVVSLREPVLKLLSNPDLADQSMFFRRWDSTVQGKTLRESCAPFTNMPYDQGIFVPDADKGYTQVLSLTINPWWSGNPSNMAKACVAGTVSKQIAAGVKRKKIALCDNFYTPKSRPEIDYHLTEMVRTITDLMIDLGTPIISGKDSSSGTTKMTRKNGEVELFDIAPTLCISAIGMGEVASKVPPKALQRPGNQLYFLPAGITNDASGSVLLPAHERQKAFNYEIDIQSYIKTIDRISELIDVGALCSISVMDDGGIIHRLFEMMLGSTAADKSGLGVELKQTDLEFLTKTVPGSFVVEVESPDVLEGLDAIPLGKVIAEQEFRIGNDILNFEEMRNVWEQTWYDIVNLPFEQKRIETPTKIKPFKPSKVQKKKVNVVYSPGINCHWEMVRAWQKLGCDVSLISVTDPHARFADADIVVFPGGFADGDYLGAAKVWWRVMETQFKDQMDFLRTGKIPVLGICNGFQLMTRSGFFGENLRLTFNESAQLEQRWVKLRFTKEAANSIWTKGLEGQEICVPVAHGEGRFVIDGKMTEATIALQYHPDVYPNNPNGSVHAIAGVFSGGKGQFFGGMPHPERAIEDFHFTQHGLLFFENVLKNI